MAAVALVATLAGGCLEPFRAHVDSDALEQSPRDWVVTKKKLDSDGMLGPKSRETLYTHEPPQSAQPPYPGALQVFSLRELDRRSTSSLLEWTEDVVDQAVMRENIVLNHQFDDEGERRLENGVRTHWFTRQGRVEEQGDLFLEDVTVRIIGEVGHDGRSDTSFVAVAYVQVDREAQCPVVGGTPIPCDPSDQADLSTWIEVVGDPDGSVGGATSANGFLYHLVTS
jgi:hypothetical protein